MANSASVLATPRSLQRRVLKGLCWTVVGVGAAYALWLAWRDASLADLPADLAFGPLGVSIALRLAATLLTVSVWLGLYRGLGGAVGTVDGFRIYLLTNLGKYLPGKVMHAAGRVAMLRERGQPASIGVTSIALELVISLLAAAIVSVVSIPLLLQNQGLGGYATIMGWLAALAVPLGLISLHPSMIGLVLRLAARVMPSASRPHSRQLPSYPRILLLLGMYTVVWVLGSFALFAAARSVYPLDAAWLPAMGGIAALSYVAGVAVPFAPAGLGAREGLMTLLLSTMMPAPAAAVAAVLYRLVSVLAELTAAGLTMLLGLRRPATALTVAPAAPLLQVKGGATEASVSTGRGLP
ncbi:MAG: lysylphosphatidylglycerol synthase domain-containing protein [Chloroflexota bacterium]